MFSGHTHLFLINCAKPFFRLNQRVKVFFVPFVSFYWQTFLTFFCLILFNLLIQILTLANYSFKPSQYTYGCNNWHKLWKSTKLGIFLILQDLLNLCAYGYLIRIFLWNIFFMDIFRENKAHRVWRVLAYV